MVGGRENGTHPSSVHPPPPKNEPLLEGNPTNVAVGELETGISSAQTHRSWKNQSCQKTNGAFQLLILIYNAIVTVPLTIRSR